MVDIIILLLLIFGFFVGIKRGFIMQVMRLIGTIVAFIIAYHFAGILGPELSLWIPFPTFGDSGFLGVLLANGVLENAYYHVIAFFIVFVVAKIVLFYVGSLLDFISRIPVLKQVNSLAGGVFGIVETYLVIFIVLLIASKLPIETAQTHFQNSVLAGVIVDHTPFISEKIRSLWV